MKLSQTLLLVTLCLLAFAGNSLLTRFALNAHLSDPLGFSLVRLLAGCVTLALLCVIPFGQNAPAKLSPMSIVARTRQLSSWYGGISLFGYTLCFSFAYVALDAGLGALVLFGSVQLSMMAMAFFQGERLTAVQWFGYLIAILGLVYVLDPKFSQGNGLALGLMVVAGCFWAAYSIVGKGDSSPILSSATNFLIASGIGLVVGCFYLPMLSFTQLGLFVAILTGSVTSGIGYAIWYRVLPFIEIKTAALSQLLVPIIALVMGVLWLDESVSYQVVIAAMLVIGGVALAAMKRRGS